MSRPSAELNKIYADVSMERQKQIKKWGESQDLDIFEFLSVLTEEVGESHQAALHDKYGGDHAGTLYEELIQTTATSIQILEYLLKNNYLSQDDSLSPSFSPPLSVSSEIMGMYNVQKANNFEVIFSFASSFTKEEARVLGLAVQEVSSLYFSADLAPIDLQITFKDFIGHDVFSLLVRWVYLFKKKETDENSVSDPLILSSYSEDGQQARHWQCQVVPTELSYSGFSYDNSDPTSAILCLTASSLSRVNLTRDSDGEISHIESI